MPRDVLNFPKRDFSRKDVEKFRRKELDYPKAWELTQSGSNYQLRLNKKQFKKNYVRERVCPPGFCMKHGTIHL